jgi:putative transcriptional regulator
MESRLDIEIKPAYADLESRLYIERKAGENVAQTITNRVKELRIAIGWTQEQLAHAAGVSRQSINAIERDRYVPSLELALTFARIFACPTDQIFQLEIQR